MDKLIPLLWEEKLLANNNRSETSQRSEISLDTANRLKQSIFKSGFHSETLSWTKSQTTKYPQGIRQQTPSIRLRSCRHFE